MPCSALSNRSSSEPSAQTLRPCTSVHPQHQYSDANSTAITIGPFDIIKVVCTNAYQLHLPKTWRGSHAINIQYLKPFHENKFQHRAGANSSRDNLDYHTSSPLKITSLTHCDRIGPAYFYDARVWDSNINLP